MNKHGTVVAIQSAEQIETRQILPTRNEFLDANTVQNSQGLLRNNQPILFLGNDVAQSIAKDQYELILHGIMPCGTKTTVSIKGIYPYVDVETRTNIPVGEQVLQLKNKLNNHEIDFKNIEVIEGKNFMKFHAEQRQYMRVRFNALKPRLDFIKLCADDRVNTFSNDRSTYYRVVARNYEFNLSGWNRIQSYRQVNDGKYKSAVCITCDVNHIAPFDADLPENLNVIAHMGYAPNLLKYEQMIVAGFDIEMIPYHPNAFPDADKCIKDSIFMICATFHFAKKPESILSVILTLKENEPLDDVITIVCENESCLLLAFSQLMHMMQPDFITEFNGGGFDWRNIITKTRSFGDMPQFLRNMSIARMLSWELKDTMLSRYFQEKVIKIDGATAPCICKTLKVQGYVNFDTLVLFKQIEPKADSHRLDECLKRCNLGGKDSLAIAEMFRIYKHGTAAEMRLVAHYCFIDTCKLQALILKKNVIQDRREIALMSFTSIYDAFYYANGSKVRNLMMNVGEGQGYKFDTTYKPDIEDPDAKFQGAYVVPPIKGVVRPMLSYEEYNLEHKVSANDEILRSGYAYIDKHYDAILDRSLDRTTVPEPLIPYVDYLLTNETHYPVSGLDFSSLYPSIMMAYNITPEKLITDEEYANQVKELGYSLHEVVFPFLGKDIHAWFVQHENVKEKYGLGPSILIDLFAKRAALKKLMKPFAHRKLQLEEEMSAYKGDEPFPHMQEYDEVCFEYNYFNSKQGAAKVFMNTFYGEMGNFMSFVCAIETAASVTAMGRYNLKLAKKYVEDNLKMKVYYGDSVTGDTPIMIQRDGVKNLIPIEELDSQYSFQWNGKEFIDYSNRDLKVMSDTGYVKVLKLIRHKTTKRLFRINTAIGSVVVTEDHSLLDQHKQKVAPGDCIVGTTRLLHWSRELIYSSSSTHSSGFANHNTGNNLSNDIAYLYGFFLRYGHCLTKRGLFGNDQFEFKLTHSDLNYLEMIVMIFNKIHIDVRLKINFHMPGSKFYTASIDQGDVFQIVQLWRSLFYTTRNQRCVPRVILNSNNVIKSIFMRGYSGKMISGNVLTDIPSQIEAQGILLVLMDLGFYVSVHRVLSTNKYELRPTRIDANECTIIASIESLGLCTEYVYDLETESHHFAAGVGQMVVHNTDSLYISCNKAHFYEYDREYYTGKIPKLQYCTNLVSKTFELIEDAKHGVNQYLKADNKTDHLRMAYEEVLYPMVLVSKKKYFGIAHEESVNFYPKKPFLRGLEIVKRGVSEVLKDVCMQIVNGILDIKTTTDMMSLVRTAIHRFFSTEWDVSHFIKTAVYRLDKANPCVKKFMARYEEMQYPSIPEPNVRFKYIMCKKYRTYDTRGLQIVPSVGDCMELVDRVIAENIPIDLEYYFNREITGQLGRLIAFYDQFDTVDSDSLSDTLTEKERYTKIEETIFKNAKKYIAELASQYSNPFQNKGRLFKNTYRLISKTIKVKNPKTKNVELMGAPGVQRVVEILNGCNKNQDLRYMRRCIEQHIVNENGPTIDDSLIQPLFAYVSEHQLFGYLQDCAEEWIANIVQHVRVKYDFEALCLQRDSTNEPLELFSKEDLIQCISEVPYIGLSVDHAKVIQQMIDTISSQLA